MAEKYDVLAQKTAPLSSALSTDMPVIPTRKDGSPDYMAGYKAYKDPQLKETKRLLEEQGAFEGLQREEETRQKGVSATGKAANLRKLKSDIEESQTSKDLTTLEDQYMHAAFVPTQATMGEMAAMFSLFGVAGMLIGAGGKGNSQAAMSAMSGMMKGYREGNEDLYKKEKSTFDENLKVMGQRKEVLSKRLEQIAKLAIMDKDAADQDLDALLAEKRADFYKKYKDKFGLAKLIEFDKEVNKTHDKMYDFVVKEDERVREEARRRAEKLADEQRRKEDKIEAEQREETRRVIDDKRRFEEKKELVEFAAGLKGGGGAGELPKDTKTRDEHRFRHVATENLKDILKDLQNPEIRKLIGPQNQYLPDVILNLSDKYPQLAQKLARFQSNEFLIGGKSLTTTEQRILGPIYNWRGLTAKALEDNLKEATREMGYQQSVLEEGYPGLKEMTKRYSGASGEGIKSDGAINLRANLPKANPGEQIHEDAQGNRAVKRGNDWVEVQ